MCHEAGASAIAYSPKRQCLISGGRKGYVCVFDVRQHSLLRSFLAHSGPVTSVIINDTEEYFVTGSSDGMIKIWDLVTLDKKHTFFKEGSRTLRLFKGDSGIADMYLSFKSSLLYSVSGDGVVRCRSINVV
jgi:WD40 repeat protein